MVGKAEIIAKMKEFDAISEAKFLAKYSNGYGSRTTWIKYGGREHPIKAIWAAAHVPPIPPTSFTTHDAKRPLGRLGFEIVERKDTPPQVGAIPPQDRSLSFSAFCASLEFPLKNVRWSWSALSASGEQSLFTVWDNEILSDGRTYLFWDGKLDAVRADNGAREIKRLLDESLDKNLTTYGIKCTPVYPLTVPRVRSTFDQTNLLALRLRREGKNILGTIVGTASAETLRAGFVSTDSAIDDLDSAACGNEQPGRAAYSGSFIIRDDRVRQEVLKRAQGRCEYCGVLGFKKPDGSHFVEAHHIISLDKQGPDTLGNVIALCPNHHREAHFGEGWEQLEAEFKSKLAKLRGK
jgi:5-methylcytosine-specific restriction enzyme A